MKKNLTVGLIIFVALGFCHCVSGSLADGLPPSVTEMPFSELEPTLNLEGQCQNPLDLDCDGVWADCDASDVDPSILLLRTCDEDADGFADTDCQVFADENQDGLVSEDERLLYGQNCDVCPEMADPDQTDSDGNGVGDACETETRENFPQEPEASESPATISPIDRRIGELLKNLVTGQEDTLQSVAKGRR